QTEWAACAVRVIALMEAVAPGFTGSVRHRQVIGPHTMQNEYGLVGGNIFHGELTPGQMFHGRPAAGYADLRTPIRGLYQAGSATHGGGGVTGIPGRNVVRQIRRDPRPCCGASVPREEEGASWRTMSGPSLRQGRLGGAGWAGSCRRAAASRPPCRSWPWF